MISKRLKKVILKTLRLDNVELTEEMEASEVPGWDSLSHINVILAIEEEFEVRFKDAEIIRLKNIGELQKLIDSQKK